MTVATFNSLPPAVFISVFVYGCLPLLFLQIVSAELCTEAHNKCISRLACSNALTNYMLNCGSLIHGDTNECTTRCRKALISLLSTDEQEGAAYMKCDCAGNTFCENQKSRMRPCSEDVLRALKHINDVRTQINCSLAILICQADTPCVTALAYYKHNCEARLLRGDKCTPKCNNSVSILYRQPKAVKLRTCVCDGTENYQCDLLQRKTERQCFGQEPKRHRHEGHKHHDNQNNGHHRNTEMRESDQHGANDTTNSVDANAQRANNMASSSQQHQTLHLFSCFLLLTISRTFSGYLFM